MSRRASREAGTVLASVLLVAAASPATAMQPAARIHVREDDPNWPVVRDEIEYITTAVGCSSGIGRRVGLVERLGTERTRALFPGWAFYRFTYSEHVTSEWKLASPPSLAGHLEHVLAVAPDGLRTITVNHGGGRKGYEELLKATRVTVRKADDVARVCRAFLDLHPFRRWKRFEIRWVSRTEWRVITGEYEQTVSADEGLRHVVDVTHFVTVRTHRTSRCVTGWETGYTRSDPRAVPIESAR